MPQKTEAPNKKATTQRQKKSKPAQKQASSFTLNDLVDSMSDEEFIEFQSELSKRRLLGGENYEE